MKKDNVDLICSIGELAGLFEKTESLEDFLQQVVSIVAYHMRAAVCSIYLFDRNCNELVMKANQGLNPDLIGKVRLKLGEGITGTSLKELRPICEADGSKNPNFKYIPGSDEERYRAFLAVPILRGLIRVGVLVVQDPQPSYFDDNDVKALRAIAAQLSSTIENAQLFISLHELQNLKQRRPEAEKSVFDVTMVKGLSASRGIAFGTATGFETMEMRLEKSSEGNGQQTLEDFRRALTQTEAQLKELQQLVDEQYSDVASLIFSAHLLMLMDPDFSGEMIQAIENGTAPRQAVRNVINKYARLFSSSDNPALQDKVQDVRDLGHRLLLNLKGGDEAKSDYKDQIIITRELLPSDIVKLSAQKASGLILTEGGVSSHVSVLARSLQLPTVIVKEHGIVHVQEGVPIIVDANQGNVFIHPTDDVVSTYRTLLESEKKAEEVEADINPQTQTQDGQRVTLYANINLLSDLSVAARLKAEGIGLYRSEFPFIVRNDFPSEEEQYRIYKRLIDGMAGKAVTIRTLDVGGDKMLSYYPSVKETNPFLGLRAIRFSLKNRAIFSQQLRAILRAGYQADLRIMFPLISSLDDYLQAKEVVDTCREELSNEHVDHHENPKLGVMIELPSAVEIVDELAEAVDFISIGSNDLIQYYLAVDRTNEQISDMYISHHPAILRAIQRIVDAGQKHHKEVSICGDMASDRQMIPFLIGAGIKCLSLDPHHIPQLQNQIQKLNMEHARQFADRLLKMKTVSDIVAYLEKQVY